MIILTSFHSGRFHYSKGHYKNLKVKPTKIPRHERVNLSARTCRDISTNVSRPRHVRVEVNLTIFLRNGPGSFKFLRAYFIILFIGSLKSLQGSPNLPD
jgi:hypothetical protein